jgi:amidase
VIAGRTLDTPPPRAPRLALAPELLERATPGVARQVRAVGDRLADAGAVVTEVTLPASFASIHEAGQAVLQGEAATYHEALHRAHAADYRPRTRALVEAGLAQRTVDYVRAQHARSRFRDDVMPLLGGVDALLSPTAPSTAPRGLESTGDPWFCAPWTFAGVPAISLPAGVSPDGLPHAIQLVAAAEADARLLAVAAWCEGILGVGAAPPG